ncbi:MAG: hypothetical protein OR994_02415 [Candidatus Poseidoniales archaeon]|jgi:hypothetical protein|nr:hypothetical protein [Candidatus Poseidoniales archaeon]|tara:strand:+ start:461 stop:988 length:528 start_codon:yes stop_codon:yes gene_type:complete
MNEKKINLDVETQTFRFTPSEPINQDEAVSLAKGVLSGEYVVIIHDNPHATLIVEPEGSVLVHGLSRSEVARLAVQELLLTLGMSDEWLILDSGEMIVRFSIGRAVLMDLAADRFSEIDYDARIGALRINADRHKCTILLFNNGHGIILKQTSKRIAEMAIRYWSSQLDDEGALA